jgi:hypothetical protein
VRDFLFSSSFFSVEWVADICNSSKASDASKSKGGN